ncbi:uncharacterized protein DEA37_0008459 [Paragonimus westermani]|uniref:LicD/FKTN/FKRP nucleotidyltransferase domain-containing protein n=1 Tax=Paragonimus westermani TaxID=34504 RepID=A0A5J4NGV9_9TREM|nr:uncharacterized protein DEA37_0008459 [Paragonimus westermani]
MRLGLVPLVLAALATGIFWIDHLVRYGEPHSRNSQPLVLPLSVQVFTDSVYLILPRLESWIEASTSRGRTEKEISMQLQNVILSFCHLVNSTGWSHGLHNCCQAHSKLTSRERSMKCLQSMESIGPMPTVYTTNTRSKTLPDWPTTFVHPQIYTDAGPVGQINCPVRLDRRERIYRLLRYWIELAERHNIVWWLSYGSLLGSVRHGDFIPYDHDADIAVIGSQADLIRSLSVHWSNVSASRVSQETFGNRRV